FYPSPMADFGYDVADYCDVNPLFGDLATFDRLVTESHRRGIKIIVDYVPNHSSDQHPWFIESRKGRDNPKRDWYIWRDPQPDAGGSYPSGPDLPPNDIFARQLHLYNEDQDEVHEIMRGFRRLLDEYGERCAIGELGIENGLIPPEKMQDPQGIRLGPERSRDVGRTPMQWDSSPHAGFSSAEPWLPVSADYATRNVAAQIADPHSILNLYRRLLWYRRQTPALQRGGYRAVDAGREGCFVYWREDAPGCFLIALNFTGAAARLSTPGGTIGQITLSTHLDRSESVSLSHLHLRPNEGVIIEAG
ncbi:MAG: alpha-amylase family glycosyl hydrolase, partial [Anaerolineales bacterium]